MYDDDDDDDAPMTSMPRIVHRQKSIGLLFFLSSSFLSLVVTIRSFDDVSQCVDMKKQDDAATITTAIAIGSQRFRGLINPNKTE
jgi:hypothetical protein